MSFFRCESKNSKSDARRFSARLSISLLIEESGESDVESDNYSSDIEIDEVLIECDAVCGASREAHD